MRRVVVGEFKHETNTFFPLGTDLDKFNKRTLKYGQDMFSYFKGTRTSIGGFIDSAAKAGVELIPSIAADATPSGKVTKEAYEHIVGTLLNSIKEAMDSPQGIDGVALSLHGAMVAEHIDDGEGELLRRIREFVGEDIPIVVTLDLHANLTSEMVNNADCIFGYDTNPHVDLYERAQEAFQALVDIWEGKFVPVMHLFKTEMLVPTINMRTAEGPMVELFKMAVDKESNSDVRNVSVFGGFPFADVPFAGLSILTLTNNQPDLAKNISEEIGARAWEIRHEFIKELWKPADAVRYAMKQKEGPIILADVGDNPGGGGSGETTGLLRELVAAGAKDVGFALIVDPEVVEQAIKSGPGARIKIPLGGKLFPGHGEPVECEGIVKAVTDGIYYNKGPMQTGVRINLGKTARISINGIDVIVVENRVAPNDPEIFRHVGIEPTEKKILVVKSRGHFRAAFETFAKEILEVDCPGFASPNLKHFRYKKVRRPIFPLDEWIL